VKTPKPDFVALLGILAEHEVKFIIVGGVCGVLHGAPITTFDLDLVHSRDAENVDSLLAALQSMNAVYRDHAERRIPPDRTHLASPGHQLLMTDLGPLDLSGTVGHDVGYEALLSDTTVMTIGDLRVRVLNLEKMIELKQQIGRDKDKAVISILRRTHEEKQKR
jgi:predicted nucleotidyltransferase